MTIGQLRNYLNSLTDGPLAEMAEKVEWHCQKYSDENEWCIESRRWSILANQSPLYSLVIVKDGVEINYPLSEGLYEYICNCMTHEYYKKEN